MNDSGKNLDAEKSFVERHGGEFSDKKVAPQEKSTITKRCRERLAWAAKSKTWTKNRESLLEEKSTWVCDNIECDNELCASFHRFIEVTNQVEKFGEKIVAVARNSLLLSCKLLEKEHNHVKFILEVARDAGNKTDYKHLTTNRSELIKEYDARQTTNIQPQSPSRLSESLTENLEAPDKQGWGEIFSNLPGDPDMDRKKREEMDNKTREETESFYKYCDEFFANSTCPPDIDDEDMKYYDKPGYADNIQKTVNAIVEWNWEKWKEEEKREKRTPYGKGYWHPFPVGHETKGSQPILYAIMWKINIILQGTNHFTREQYVIKDSQKKGRMTDFMCSEAPQQMATWGLIGKSIEIKPIFRKKVSHEKLMIQGSNQILGYNNDVVFESCFNFCEGLGRDGKAFGIAASMISTKLMETELTGVGSEDVKYTNCASKTHRLFSKNTTNNLILVNSPKKKEDKPRKKELEQRERERKREVEALFGRGEENSPAIELGFRLLVQFIANQGTPKIADPKTSKNEFMFIQFKDENKKYQADNLEYLGSGAFGSTYKTRLKSDDDTDYASVVIKMSKGSEPNSNLQTELNALKELTDNHDIPKLFKNEIATITVKKRCEQNNVSALALKMKAGKSVQKMLKDRLPINTKDVLETLLNDIKGALDYAHEKYWYHFDVNPSNIVAVDGEKFVLIDWGTAVKKEKKEAQRLISFRGTPPYSHPEMFKTDGVERPVVHEKFDMFSLAMTIASIEHGGVPWSGFHRKKVTPGMIEDRDKTSVDLIVNSALDAEWKKKLIGWIRRRKSPSPKIKKAETVVDKNDNQVSQRTLLLTKRKKEETVVEKDDNRVSQRTRSRRKL